MDELIDILDMDGNLTGETVMKSVAHRKGLFHQTIHVWFYTKNGDILIQQRGKNKTIHPLLWDVSVAGHIGAGEAIEISALREVEEEIGLIISQNELQKIGIFKSFQKHSDTLIDYEFHHTFIVEFKVPLKDLTKKDSEIKRLDIIPINLLKKIIQNQKTTNKFAPHGSAYYNTITETILSKL
ncbi:NUDIX domain-containing protein [Maribacter sp.]|uniref:NUDIX hydrolase n=1 Tax=Maribacter sp. TaxID=1897614 RepID=UPI0025C2432D|nr:NUDIX domain-containing protein [Maribacter sp.]